MGIRFSPKFLHSGTLSAKIREWIGRYGIAELWSFAIGLVLTVLFYSAFQSIVGSAFVGSFVQTAVFYLVIAYRDVRERMLRDGKQFGLTSVWKLTRNMILEFGPAEYLDTFIIRPFLFSIFPLFVPLYPLAITLATVVADITYYLPVISTYEIRKKYLND
ncbi:MAG TPA: hypothetical protein VJK52_01605 [Candidatus Nanoarchaeia archaeon]|nr:hypothetical protein [Candidatus Nanoarchaeia archaeon]